MSSESQGEFSTIAEEVVDENLTLLLAKGDGVPRLGIFNTGTNKKKYTYLSWAEGAERSLKIKKKSGTAEYPMETIQRTIASLIQSAESSLNFKSIIWRGVQVIGDVLQVPKTARTEGDCNLINEKKRDAIWFAYTPKDEPWRVRPCFIPTEAEARILSGYIMPDAKPWPSIQIAEGSLPLTMRNAPYAKEVINATPARWSELMLPISRAAILGFCDWSPNGEHTFGESLWKHLPSKESRSEETIAALTSAGKEFMARVVAYLRLWPVLDAINVELVDDSGKTSDERGLKKRERFEMISAPLSDRRFKLMRYSTDDGTIALSVTPDTRTPGEKDKLYTFDEAAWNSTVDTCSMGGQQDPQFASISLIWAMDVRDWIARIESCTSTQPRTVETAAKAEEPSR